MCSKPSVSRWHTVLSVRSGMIPQSPVTTYPIISRLVHRSGRERLIAAKALIQTRGAWGTGHSCDLFIIFPCREVSLASPSGCPPNLILRSYTVIHFPPSWHLKLVLETTLSLEAVQFSVLASYLHIWKPESCFKDQTYKSFFKQPFDFFWGLIPLIFL